MSVFAQWGLRRVINASGKMTALGSSAVAPEVASALAAAASEYVIMDELLRVAGERIARATGAEFAVPTMGAAAGIVLSVAACVAGKDPVAIESLPDSRGRPNEVVLPKGHSVHFGGAITQMIRLGGGMAVEAGHANLVLAEHVEHSITPRTVALFYCKSHHAVQKGMVSLPEMIEIGKRHGLPVIVDAAAEEDLKKYVAMGADLVCYSGGKAIGGPTSGFICGRRDLVEACVLQYRGVGRAMKVSKEAISGLLAALELYEKRDHKAEARRDRERMERLVERLNTLPGLRARVIQDEAGREIYRARIEVLPESGLDARQIIAHLETGDPAIFTRNHYANVGILDIDPRTLLPGQEDLIVERLREVLKGRERA
ncbi:pyridoxal phosphate-dependent enzyme [Thermaerobacter marianensis DSM 12885]|uniref:Pyridoxal phosphate-dependent enzyme n=1 Tax=Thermaerobacter marianensis (strain ATCC 700841 / DSM 12885 / JCM 10246 / 7p75a) TaxID=644966 RepID=E6SGS6_THEM7|nr:DgaE family pyridoxal phosphate-dependent ammonia lyase [Thermaerobacter marianensis]ADU51660.1 pyridoxal phosphate-dependent enzyme [Thermaerobacter marianensis DSM 12885]